MGPPKGLVLDTSVWINLLATEQIQQIVKALDCPCIAPKIVVDEIRHDPITQKPYNLEEHPLTKISNIQVIDLDDDELDLFIRLVGQHPTDSLGDGEAAAIAAAKVRGLAVALDDKKARRIMREQYPDTPVLMSIDILQCNAIRTLLGDERAQEAIDKAVRFGKMHIPKAA
jgi:predicted nucleic acid-binding protein